MYIYIYIYTYIYIYLYMYIYTYIQSVTKVLVPPFLMLQDSHFDIIKYPFKRIILQVCQMCI